MSNILFNILPNTIASFFADMTFGKKILLLFTPILTAILSMKAALLGLGILIVIDLLTGIKKNLHMRGIAFNVVKASFWRAIKSYLLRQTWRKTYEYGIGIITIMVVGKLVFGGLLIEVFGKEFFLSELAILVPATIEVWSIFENIEAVTGKNFLKSLKYLLPANLAAVFNANTDRGREIANEERNELNE